MARHPREPLHHHPIRRPPIERVTVIPPLDEGAKQVTDDRSPQLQSSIVPRRPLAVPAIHRRLLRIPEMLPVIAALVRQVDTADKSDIPPRFAPMPHDEQLLMVRGQPSYPLVEQHLGTSLVELRAEPLVLLRVELQVV
jgi:hypothetical protein